MLWPGWSTSGARLLALTFCDKGLQATSDRPRLRFVEGFQVGLPAEAIVLVLHCGAPNINRSNAAAAIQAHLAEASPV